MQDHARPIRSRDLTIGHATDLSGEEGETFAHAVALARASASRLLSIHVNDDPQALSRMPRAVDLLQRWSALPSGAEEGEEQKLGMRHERVVDSSCDDPVDTLLEALRKADPDLLVGATSGREGLSRAMLGSVAEALALHLHVPTLLFPVGCRAFVSEQTGQSQLSRMLVAAGDLEASNVGAARALWLAQLLGVSDVEIELLHVEDGTPAPSVSLPAQLGVRFRNQSVRGPLEAALLDRARSTHADVIVMATRGHDSLRDVLLGSHAERVLRRAPCSVLSVPLH